MSTAIAAIPTNALATVGDEISLTLGIPAEMTDDELAGVVKQAFAKIRDYIPYIVALKIRFTDGERDSANRLLAPISGCHSWKEFCTSILHRTPRNIWDACRDKKSKQLGTDVDVAKYEQEHPSTRQLAEKFLAQMTPEDAIGALVGQEVPQSIAEAIVRIVVAENSETPPRDEDPTATAAASLLALELTNLFKVGEVQRANDIGRFHVSIAVHGISEAAVRKLAAFIGELA